MKALDCFLFICAIALLGASYFLITKDHDELGALGYCCAYICGTVAGTRIGITNGIASKTKALDYFLFICAIALLGVSYFLNTKGNYALAALVNCCAYICGTVAGTRIGIRIYKKNQENK